MKLKKEQNYTSTPVLDLRGLFQGDFAVYFHMFSTDPVITIVQKHFHINFILYLPRGFEKIPFKALSPSSTSHTTLGVPSPVFVTLVNPTI
jgi:hypothetical protein